MVDAVEMILAKRQNGEPHADTDIREWIAAYARGDVPDYQMSAWLMAVCWRGMTSRETAVLTESMVRSGIQVQWPLDRFPFLVDKHSTGGVGDKISIVLAPLVASLGVRVPMMAGRGLGHTGGTIDKLEAIPGYVTVLPIPRFQQIVQDVGCSIIAASNDICLADRKLYALRDVTGTVSSIPLQTASIMCKKIAEHPRSLVLDCKFGRGSFQSTVDDAAELARSMIATGEANGLAPTTCFLTRMDSVIGKTVGNWVEIVECIDMLKTGTGCNDLKTLVVIQASQMVFQSGKYSDMTWDQVVDMVHAQLQQGKAFPTFCAMVEAHGGDVSVCHGIASYPHSAAHATTIKADTTRRLKSLDGLAVGRLCVHLGAGRQVAGEAVDPAAGVVFDIQVGDVVRKGGTIATVYTNRSRDVLETACQDLLRACEWTDVGEVLQVPPIVSHKVTSEEGAVPFILPECLNV